MEPKETATDTSRSWWNPARKRFPVASPRGPRRDRVGVPWRSEPAHNPYTCASPYAHWRRPGWNVRLGRGSPGDTVAMRAVVGDEDARLDLVAGVDHQGAVVDDLQQQRGDVVRESHRRCVGHLGRQVARTDNGDPVRGHDRLARYRALDVSAKCARREVDEARPGAHLGNCIGRAQQRRPPAGHLCGGDNDVEVGDVGVELLLLSPLLLRREGARVAALTGGFVDGVEVEIPRTD